MMNELRDSNGINGPYQEMIVSTQDEQKKEEIEEIIEESSLSRDKALYNPGLDMRQNIYELDDDTNLLFQRVKEQAKAIAALIPNENLIEKDGKYVLSNSVNKLSEYLTNVFGYPLGESERFCDEPKVAFGSAFLIKKRLLLTAAHCVCKTDLDELNDEQIKKTRVIFNFHMKSTTDYQKNFKKNEVYEIEKVVAHEFNTKGDFPDWALVKLKKKVTGVEPLKISFSPILEKQVLYMMGHPSGIPLKWTSNGKVISLLKEHFECNLDAFGGNSGSAVFDQLSGEIIGILDKGKTDYELTKNYKGSGNWRMKPYYVKKGEGYEQCQRLDTIEVIKKLFLANGLNIQAYCNDEKCSMYQQKIFVQKGFGLFEMGKEFVKHQCNVCDKKLKATYLVFLQNSIYSYEGADDTKNYEKKNEQVAGSLMLDLNDWSYCNIKIQEKN